MIVKDEIFRKFFSFVSHKTVYQEIIVFETEGQKKCT